MATPAVPIGSPGPAELAALGGASFSSYFYPTIATSFCSPYGSSQPASATSRL